MEFAVEAKSSNPGKFDRVGPPGHIKRVCIGMDTTTADGDSERILRLHFEGELARGHTLPAPALVKSLQQLQRIVHLIAMQTERRAVRQRARLTREMEELYALVCRLPEEGGYALPVEIGRLGDKLFDAQAVVGVANGVRRAIEAVASGEAEKLIEAVPDSYYRKSVLEAFKAMQPPSRSGLVVHIEDFRRQKLLDGFVAADHLAKLMARPASDAAGTPAFVTGALATMEFQERRLRLQLLGTGRALEASYSDDFEPVLLEHPRELIQIHGNVIYGDDGQPSSISEVDEILEVDDSAISVISVIAAGRSLKLRAPLIFTVNFDPETQSYDAQGPFEIIAGAQTRRELEENLDAELAMLWGEYALADPELLTPAAQRLRLELLDAFEDNVNAA